jgi:hypothetical protein
VDDDHERRIDDSMGLLFDEHDCNIHERPKTYATMSMRMFTFCTIMFS